ncbi:MAG TPA: hypothetical protein DER40_13610 [Geobacter sp.]|nr:hypothetical protein [Geobacter sp.]HCE68502.1 hypothetical protein [Geobacter sp.]
MPESLISAGGCIVLGEGFNCCGATAGTGCLNCLLAVLTGLPSLSPSSVAGGTGEAAGTMGLAAGGTGDTGAGATGGVAGTGATGIITGAADGLEVTLFSGLSLNMSQVPAKVSSDAATTHATIFQRPPPEDCRMRS